MTALHVATNAIQLRPYQIEDRLKVVQGFLEQGFTRILGVWPTGAGKTVLFSELHQAQEMQDWLLKYPVTRQKILVLAHRDELIDQAARKLRHSNPGLFVDIDQADKRASPLADVVVASVQTLTRSKGKRLHRLDPDLFRIIVVDEAHHAASPSYQVILQWFGFLPEPHFMESTKPDKKQGKDARLFWQRQRLDAWDALHRPDRLLLGVTATPKRGDNVGLECVFQDIAFERTIRWMVENGYLCPLRAFRVLSNTSIEDVATRAGDFAVDELATAINVDDRNAKAVRGYLDYTPGLMGVTFCANVAHATAMAAAFNLGGVPAAVVHGNMPKDERKRVLSEFAAGNILMLTNCNVLTEGFDEPNIRVIIHAKPTKSSLNYIQMTGRGLRIAPGKPDCVIIDIVDVTRKHSLFTSPELFGLPANFDAKGGDLLGAKKFVEEIEKQNPLADVTSITSIEDCKLKVKEVDLLNLGLARFHDENIDRHAELAWRKTGEGYELDWRGELLNEAINITQLGTQWKATHTKGKRTHWEATADSPEAAIRAGERFLKNNSRHVYQQYRKETPNGKLPATPVQKEIITSAYGGKLNPANLTKDEARNLISAYYSDKRKGKI